VAVVILIYVATYLVLSMCGNYSEPLTGLTTNENGLVIIEVKGNVPIVWTPFGFPVYSEGWKNYLWDFFKPLVKIDKMFWHKTRYP